MNLKMKKISIIFFSCLVLLFIFSLKVNAASASITLDKSTVEVGDSVKITVSGKGVQWNLKLKADGEVLKTSSELENYEANKNINFSVTYTPKTTGTKNITLEGSVTEFSDGSTIKSFVPKSIVVKEKTTNNDTTSNNNKTPTTPTTPTTPANTTKSNNAYLSTLGVTPKEHDFSGFSKTKTSYSVTVPSTVDSLKVVAKAADSKATVKVSGNSGFEVGSNNTIKVVVTAEDGKTTKTYTIRVTKLAEDEEKPGNVIEYDKGLYLTSLSIEGLELSPEFTKDTYSYTATLSDSSVNEVKVNAISNKEKAKIDITGNTNLLEGENTINLVLTLDGSAEQTVYQIVLTKEATDLVATTYGNNTPSSRTDIIGMLKGYVGIAILVLVLMIVAVIVLIILLIKENKRLNEKKTEDKNYEEYNVYKNDLNEFKNNENIENIEKENFIESLYNQRNKLELDEQDKETIDEINKQTEEIFKEKQVEGQSVEYGTNEFDNENPLEERQRRRGKHF